MVKKKRIKVYSSNGKKTLLLSQDEINTIKENDNFEKIYESELSKGKKAYEIRNYYSQAFWKDLLYVLIGAFLSTIAMDYFISITGAAGLFPGGLGAIARFFSIIGASKINFSASTFYFIIYFIMNLPLAVFGFKKLGWKFSTLTVIYSVVTIFFDLILQNVPYISPNDLSLLIDYNLISTMPGAWGAIVWIFVFAIFGGIVNGFSYSIIYKANASTGGSDWITYYYSKKLNKDIGSINIKINIAILFIVICLNTVILNVEHIDQTIKLSVLYNEYDNLNDLMNSSFGKTIDQMVNGDQTTGYFKNLWELLQHNKNWTEEWFNVSKYIASSNDFDSAYTSSMVLAMKFKWIIGPSLFASLILIIIQGITVNRLYPKNKIMNLFISTTKIPEIQQYLFSVGYTNNIFIWRTVTSKKNAWSDQEQDLILISMPMIYYKKIEEHIMKIDEEMIINIIGSKKVKGSNFSFAFDTELRDKALSEEFLNNARLMKKIESNAIIKTYKKMKKNSEYVQNGV
ncbi:YitT family protein [Mesoplasma chauliocola]|uniref:YitT family protein n=1 Tax=Mesoplasma chauliocola TaxID=216427 RepID=A0A249SN34_9MOLU|nr:YitT family ABC transporter [Mesoplasma chauliocola]ASZ09030.1 YitT family protein [Mesoplasma chauliocola]